ncbi:AMP-binding enzyme [Rhodococcus sp. AW25M09]|uniref:AMP-binding enzyme n=1 Tax=Rhodococcus sp. AW25M09 TaxID=1268303 RepID=UPI001E5C5337|nr:hypothetical protein [Rhodococcus sp. AW25M09]
MANDRTGQEPAAGIVVAQQNSISVAQIRRHLRSVLPGPSVPVILAVVDALPRTPRGKLDRQALGATLATVRTAPGSPVEPVTTNHTVSTPSS